MRRSKLVGLAYGYLFGKMPDICFWRFYYIYDVILFVVWSNIAFGLLWEMFPIMVVMLILLLIVIY